jgi:ABC-type lipoprotein release transport system permease subunit
MAGSLDTLRMVTEIAWRNLLANRWKTLIVGGIIGFGALLLVLGGTLLDGVEQAMSRSIIGSIAGHIQVYSRDSKDELDVLGGLGADAPQIEPLDFGKLKQALEKVKNIEAVVPMGISSALVTSGNSIDQALARLRESCNAIAKGSQSPELMRRHAAEKGLVRQNVSVLLHDVDNAKQLLSDAEVLVRDEHDAIIEAASEPFWASFDADPFAHLEFLENRIAPVATDADILQLRYVGTDPAAFARHFDRMKIVDGGPIPPGKRGFMFSKYMYEERVKLKAARGLDKIKQARDQREAKIARDPELQRIVRENTTGVRELLLQLDAIKTDDFRTKLQSLLHSREPELGKLLSAFFKTDDANFDQRYRFFYAELAPSLELYRVKIGDQLTIKAFTRGGYVQSASVPVYGTYAFTGLEESPQAGVLNMMDLVTFRELYGFMTTERAEEIAAMRAASGARDVDRANIEADLFGSVPADEPAAAAETGAPAVAKPSAEPAQEPGAQSGSEAVPDPGGDRLAGLKGTRQALEARAAGYDPRQLEEGVILNAAVFLRNDEKIDGTMRAIKRAGKKVGLRLNPISWQKAAGLIGQFALLMRAILYTAVLIIFMVGLVVINNALVMATLERVGEIGTLRAMGAQRRLVLGMLIVESGIVGIFFGTLGVLLGATALVILGHHGIPAANDVLTFFFSGSRLYPEVTAPHMLLALGVVVFVSVISGIYPAWIAMRVSPRQAMQGEE